VLKNATKQRPSIHFVVSIREAVSEGRANLLLALDFDPELSQVTSQLTDEWVRVG